jgi:voltage-gated potassium channel Kch
MREITRSDRLRYRFDNVMSRGTIALVGWLFILSAVLISITSLVVLLFRQSPVEGEKPLNFFQLVWFSLMRTLDAGTMGGDTGSALFLTLMLVNTLGGIFIVSILIGVITTGVESKLDELRKGRSMVIEQDHTVILGWSPQVFSILSELVIANANRPRATVAILAEKDKVEMEDEIRTRIGDMGRTRVVCRTGSAMELTDLEIVNPHYARSIIILAPENGNPDSHVIKTILALTNNPGRRKEPYHIVAEVRDGKNMEVAQMVGRDEAQLVPVSDLIARITVQTCRQSGLSVVYQELMDFGGDEIYFQEEPGLTGRTFGEALLAYEESAIIGLFRKGVVQLNPPMETVITAGDQVIAISEDDDTIRLRTGGEAPIDTSAIREPVVRANRPERTLILSWNERVPTIINELDHYVALGSEVLVVADAPNAELEIREHCDALRNLTVTFQAGDTTERRTLDELLAVPNDHVIVLSPSHCEDEQEADAQTLITLLHLRDIAERKGHPFSIVSEMLDIRNRELAEVVRADDFIVSDKLISLILAQISENKHLAAVFTDLFDPEGSELYLKPAEDYVQLGQPVNFYTVVEAARRRGAVAIGYRLRAEANNAAASYGVRVNPRKSEPVTFSAEDYIVLLAED